MSTSVSKTEAIVTATMFGASVGAVISCLLIITGIFSFDSSGFHLILYVVLCIFPFAVMGAQMGRKYWRLAKIESERKVFSKYF